MESLKVRAKFEVTQITRYAQLSGGDIELKPVATIASHENKQFWNSTPSGHIDMYVSNEATFQAFELGKEYYVDFVKAEE